jgi:hypothetical protein
VLLQSTFLDNYMSVEKAHEYGHTHFSEVPSPIPWSLGLILKMFSNDLLVIHPFLDFNE